MLNICFIGLGSIGRRHIVNVCKVLRNKNIEYSIDAIRYTDVPLSADIEALISTQYHSLEETGKQYDIAFITNPTISHYNTIKEAAAYCNNLFIEKPIFAHSIDDISNLSLKTTGIYYVACPMRYDPIMVKIKELIEKETVLSVRAISSSYLPNWRNGIDYRTNYSAIKEMGGGVTLDLIHEVDYITWLFGLPNKCINVNGKYSDLETNSDDLSVYILKYSNMIAEIHLDYFGRETVRNVEIYCDACKIIGDFINRDLRYIDGAGCSKKVEFDEYEDYMKEMESFVDMIIGNRINDNAVEHANTVLKMIENSSI